MAAIKFSGGERLEAKLREIADRVGKGGTLRVGFLEGATYPDEKGTPVAHVAAIQEFGSVSTTTSEDGSTTEQVIIPPRPFFRTMIADKKAGWGEVLGKLAVGNDYDIDKTLKQMGEGIKQQLEDSIKAVTEPPLAESTIERKGFDKPLVDTGHMWQSIGAEVDTAGDS
jgi:hypothetical protein